MRRREFIAAIGGAAAWPLVARGQQSPLPVLGYVAAGFPNALPNLPLAFQEGEAETGAAVILADTGEAFEKVADQRRNDEGDGRNPIGCR